MALCALLALSPTMRCVARGQIDGIWAGAQAMANGSAPALGTLHLPGAATDQASRAVAPQIGAGAPLRCVGAHDFDVAGTTVALSGTVAFDRVCVTNHGSILATGALTLTAGLLYVDRTGSINGDPPYALLQPLCDQNGAAGATITIDARRAVLLGSIVSDGGAGTAFSPTADLGSCGPPDGGAGGTIAIAVPELTLSGPISAVGGPGGAGSEGSGGRGGSVTITIAAPPPAGTARLVRVSGGAVPDRCFPCDDTGATAGHPGAAGSVSIVVSSAVATTAPPAPAPLIATLGVASVREGTTISTGTHPCGPGDLNVGSGQRPLLDGVHRYPHVCIHNGGVLRAGPRLILLAGTIDVDTRSRISADGAVRGATDRPTTGHYVDGGVDSGLRAIPHAGVPGADGTDALGGVFGEAGPVPAPTGGRGGGSMALIARRVRIAGIVSADGTPGGDGGQGGFSGGHTGNNPSTGNAGGGSGGGIYIRADALQLTGRLSVLGGRNGAIGDGPIQQPGTSGRVTLLVDTLEAPAGGLPIDGSGLLGRTLPSDPVPAPADPAALYATATDHALSGPFLAYWRVHGGLAVLGYPRTEPFVEGGIAVQYTDRFRLELAGGQVRTASLGRLLTAGRTFPRVATVPSTSTRLFFPATGHALSGIFLAYWRSHAGAALLGAPISEGAAKANGDGTGLFYPTQWFERGRLEYHAGQAGTRYAVQLGLLGLEALRLRGWLL